MRHERDPIFCRLFGSPDCFPLGLVEPFPGGLSQYLAGGFSGCPTYFGDVAAGRQSRRVERGKAAAGSSYDLANCDLALQSGIDFSVAKNCRSQA